MWAYVKDGSIVQTNNFQTNLIINNTNFPTKYANEWTPDQKKAYGVYEVEEVNRSNLKDGEYYINDDGTLAYDSSGDKVTLTYAAATAKEIADTKWTQSEIDAGKAPTGADTNTVKNIGLTNIHKDRISSEAHSRLISTDWYASRKAEAGTAIPSAVGTYRAAVRTAAADMHTKIDAADTVAKLEALYVYNTDNPPTRPLGAWPTPVE